MALVHDAKKEIHAKIVYYGPGRSGKTTNLEFIYNKLKPAYRGKFKFMNTPGGKMVFFDFMRPELAAIKDYTVHFHIYTVPGESVDPSVWKNVLKGVDGIVFVADLEPSRTLENRRSLDGLREYLEMFGIRLDEIPFLFQCNKKDVPDSVSVDEMRNLLEIADSPVVPASARSGEGVLPALSEMVKLVLQSLRDLPVGEPEEADVVGEPPAASHPEVTPVEPETYTPEPAQSATEPETFSFDSEPLTLEPEALVLEPEPFSFEPEPYTPEPEAVTSEAETPSLELESFAFESESASFESEPLTLEPVEDEEEYSLEPELEDAGVIEDTETEALDEPSRPAKLAEVFVQDFMARATQEVPSDAAFQAPSWEAVEEPVETDAGASVAFIEPEASMEDAEKAEPELELAGAVESLGGGRFRLPVVVRVGGRESRAAISFDISIEKL